jgi:hypothetical protein
VSWDDLTDNRHTALPPFQWASNDGQRSSISTKDFAMGADAQFCKNDHFPPRRISASELYCLLPIAGKDLTY